MGLNLTVLGCGGSFAGPDNACSGYLVRSPGATTVIDLGPGTLANLQHHVDIAALDAVVLSHEHPDHWLDLPILRNAMRYVLGLEGLAVYGTAGTLDLARKLIGELDPTLRWTTIAAGSKVALGDQQLRFARTDHPVETLSVRVDADGRSLVYSADTGPGWSPATLGDAIDLLVCEATFGAEFEGTVQHLSGRQAGALADSAAVGRLLLTHLQPGSEPGERAAEARALFGGAIDVARPHAMLEV